jgi:hypothetical protein
MEAPLSICTKEEMRGVIRFLFEEGVKPAGIIRRCRLNKVIIVYRTVKFTSGQIISKREELLYMLRRYQEGRQRQGLRTVFKPLKEWYGKTDESQWTALRRLPYVWHSERSSKRKKIFIR